MINQMNYYIFSSWMLWDSFNYCCESEEFEGVHLVAGIDINGIGMATRLLPFHYASRSSVSAQGNFSSTHRLMVDTYEGGHRILALIHSHPGYGLWSNYPSDTDYKTHRLWEYTTRMIGGIWSRDGYLRFFSYGIPFELIIFGNHLKRIGNCEHVYMLKKQYLVDDFNKQNHLAM